MSGPTTRICHLHTIVPLNVLVKGPTSNVQTVPDESKMITMIQKDKTKNMTGQKSAPWIETADYRYRNKLMQILKFYNVNQ